ncbi:sulfite exporter TauE/SafE family protein [Marinomonas piezotolerans]|uniref:Sulfite exporter TauE/SafE family protein n=1 Tax=Marinomonas piezotolerans TaxID=2213058 RepID=A0A370UDG5_9GAMM|nr:sulfite exporter TauE/SafE family protein [Marinomonas piezotolerans]RDL45830.1 sulfite exporter TauE/SafE family protein [Marinomonas piezotolerans]
MTAVSVFFSGLLIGIAGAGHCIGMCGGLSSLLSLNGKPSMWRLACYNFGRVSSYALLAVTLAASIQLGTDALYIDLLYPLRTVTGIILILMGLYLCGASKWILKIERIGVVGWRILEPMARRLIPIRTNKQAFMAGVLWGWLPCGLVYSTVIWSSSHGSVSLSVSAMAGFAAGTMPAMMLAGAFSQRLKEYWAAYRLGFVFGVLIIFYGIYSIPYVRQIISAHG